MLSSTFKLIIIKALMIRQEKGENPAEAVKEYTRLTEAEQAEILAAVQGGQENG